jgi:signal transduction histidine kinase
MSKVMQEDTSQLYYFGQRILQIIQPLAVGSDRRQVLSTLVRSVADNFAADGCWLLHYPTPDTVEVVANYTYNHLTAAWGMTLGNKKPPEAITPTEWRQPLLAGYKVMVVNTYDRQQVSGCLIVATKGVIWYPETELVLQIVAEYIATALALAELNQQAHIAKVYPALYYHLTQAIVENRELNELFQIAVRDMLTALQLERGMILSLKTSDRTPDRVQVVTAIDAKGGKIENVPRSFALQDSQYCQQALSQAPSPAIFTTSSKTATETDRAIFETSRLPSTVAIPLMGTSSSVRVASAEPNRAPSNATWGWLVLQSSQPRRWLPVELDLLRCTIYQIALARIQKQALRQARNLAANRSSQVQTSLQLQAKLHEAGRKQMEKLRQHNQLKDEFISTVSHELRTPLTSMLMAIKMLRQPDLDPDRQQRYLDILEDQCQREIKLVNDLLTLQQVESQQLEIHPQSIDLNRFIEEKVNQVSQTWQEKKQLRVQLDLPEVSSQLETDESSLNRILEELLVNAGKFAIPHSIVQITAHPEPEATTIEVTNLSKLIPTTDLPQLFDKFRRAEGVTQQAIEGTGLGLALVKSLVEHLHGRIDVSSVPLPNATNNEPQAQTSFAITIPNVLNTDRI